MLFLAVALPADNIRSIVLWMKGIKPISWQYCLYWQVIRSGLRARMTFATFSMLPFDKRRHFSLKGKSYTICGLVMNCRKWSSCVSSTQSLTAGWFGTGVPIPCWRRCRFASVYLYCDRPGMYSRIKAKLVVTFITDRICRRVSQLLAFLYVSTIASYAGMDVKFPPCQARHLQPLMPEEPTKGILRFLLTQDCHKNIRGLLSVSSLCSVSALVPL